MAAVIIMLGPGAAAAFGGLATAAPQAVVSASPAHAVEQGASPLGPGNTPDNTASPLGPDNTQWG